MKYEKFTWVCTGDCDALIEYTIKDGFGWPAGEMNLTCRCGSTATCLSVEDVTIPYTDSPLPTKEENMLQETTEFVKRQNESLTQLLDTKTNTITHLQDQLTASRSILAKVINNLTEDYFFSDSMDKDEILAELCEILNVSPTKTFYFNGTMSFSGSLDVPLNELEDFDLTQALEDAYVGINNGDVVIDTYDLETVEEA